jgi:hypothetical protein
LQGREKGHPNLSMFCLTRVRRLALR